MNDFLDLAKKRKSTFEFEKTVLKDSDVNRVLEAGRWAPSSHNLQPWSFIVIKNPKAISKLMHLCNYAYFHTDPSVLIAVVLEPVPKTHAALLNAKWKEVTGYHQYLNAAMPVLNMLLEATSLGLASCILSPKLAQANALLKVPSGKKTVLLVGLGVEQKGAFKRPRERKQLDSLVSKEVYGGR